eukprot:jgi/Tetstr1/448949/TSEL_036175.t1
MRPATKTCWQCACAPSLHSDVDMVHMPAEMSMETAGALLATTSFCVAIHPEVPQCDNTLKVTDGAASFNADNGYLAGLPEHVWRAPRAIRTSIKASVGREARFDKMHAYNADMEAARLRLRPTSSGPS